MKKDPKRELVEILTNRERVHQNSKYGELIIQSNEIQFLLMGLILFRSYRMDKDLKKYLEGLTLGSLINIFRVCAKSSFEVVMFGSLVEYNKSRNALAHKMFTKKKLTKKACESSIELGEKLLEILVEELMHIKQSKYNEKAIALKK